MLTRMQVNGSSISRFRSQFEVLLDAPEDTESLPSVQVYHLTLDNEGEVLSVPVEVGSDNKVKGVSEGDYLRVEVEGPRSVDKSLLPNKFIGFMQVDSSGYDNHRYSVRCLVDECCHIKKLPTAMLLRVFDTTKELVELAKERIVVAL